MQFERDDRYNYDEESYPRLFDHWRVMRINLTSRELDLVRRGHNAGTRFCNIDGSFNYGSSFDKIHVQKLNQLDWWLEDVHGEKPNALLSVGHNGDLGLYIDPEALEGDTELECTLHGDYERHLGHYLVEEVVVGNSE